MISHFWNVKLEEICTFSLKQKFISKKLCYIKVGRIQLQKYHVFQFEYWLHMTLFREGESVIRLVLLH